MRTDFEQEVMDRVIRIESRMVQLGDHVGANLRTKQKIDIRDAGDGKATVSLDSLDVSISRIRTELTGFGAEGPVPIYHEGKLVAVLYP